MRITSIRTSAVRAPLRIAAKWSGGTRLTAPGVLVLIDTDEGLTGVGECVGPTLPPIQTIVEKEVTPLLTGCDPARLEWLRHRFYTFAANWKPMARHAWAGVEMALFDLLGKAFNLPVVQLLGGVCRSEVDFIGYVFIDTPEQNAQLAGDYVRQGFRTLKVKVGRNIGQDVERLRAIREAVGEGVKIRIDSNMAWSVKTAIEAIKKMERFALQYVEQPVPDWDLEAMAEVRRAVGVPIAADEACTDFRSALELVKRRACDVFVVYLSEAGGFGEAKKIVALAQEEGIACVLGTWAELGVGTLAAVHFVASCHPFPFANDTHYPLQQDDVLGKMLEFQDGKLRVPQAPGLGGDLSMAKVQSLSQVQLREAVFFDPDNPDFLPPIGEFL